MSTFEDKAKKIFGERAATYTVSRAHKDPEVLARLVELAQPQKDWLALDVATGTGHTAFAVAPFVKKIIGTDITPQMLDEARKLQKEKKIDNAAFKLADTHNLPFADEAFNLITCRRSAHHFSDIIAALKELRRVLRRDGRLVIDDRSIPEDDFIDKTMNLLDIYHDESHVRQYRPSEWKRMLVETGFTIETIEPYTKLRPISALTEGVSKENTIKIHQTIERLTPDQEKLMGVTTFDGEIHNTHWFVLIAAAKSIC